MYSSCPSVLQVNGPWGEDACTHVSWILHTRARSSHCAGPRDALTPRSLQASLPHLLALYGHRPARHSVHRCCRRLRPRRQSGRCRASLRCIRSCASEIRVSRADETVTSVVARLGHVAVRVSTPKGPERQSARWRARHGCASRAVLCCALCEYRLSASSLHRCPAPVRARPPWRSQWPTQQPCPCRGLSRTRSWSRKHGHTLQQATRYACITHHHSVPCVRALKYAVGATYMLCAS